ncbi:MAG TPA: carnitine dehydratase [Dehalococcoidia bacterium]|jgi:CoA:oxalate CoA-transferase|nr:carnitine dehydratase [Chloroflexota bacterium]HCE77209.1 carnitine dehydratase [Dehalococcoidia bacterium]|tara:strand:+ start:1750 stop:2961 length:1212 start_codon:yes stop_codon:yes gene_type:complete
MSTQNGNGGPLAGIRMLDLGRYQAGPRCALMFARMGAEVIKVEALKGDESRQNGPTVRGQSAYWVQYNSGKKSLAIDLRTEKGKEVLTRLVKKSDILLQNFRPGTIDIMGFGYDVLKKLNPKIIMINASAYGQYGPHRDKVGFDPIGQAMGGMMYQSGLKDDPPTKTAFPLIDRITSLHATIGALAALWEREISGEGQAIDVSLADTGFTVNEIPITAYLGNGHNPERPTSYGGAENPLGGMYETSDGFVIIAAGNDNIWKRMCEAVGKPEWLTDERFSTRAARAENGSAINGVLSSWFAEREMKEVVEYLSEHSIPCAPVNNVEQAANESHLHEREILMEVPDPIAGKIHVAGKMIKFSRTEMVVGSTPTVGQHTDEILKDIAEYSEDEIKELEKDSVVARS